MKRRAGLTYREAEAVRMYAEERAHRTFHPLRPGLSQLIPHLLRSGAFILGVPKGVVDTSFRIHDHDSTDQLVEGQEVRYQGPQLGQFHKRVVMGLLLLAAGKDADEPLKFNARKFLALIGREECTTNVQALRRALADLRAGTFTVTKYDGDVGAVFGIVSEAEWVKRSFCVVMSRRFAHALESLGRTYIPMKARNRLADGVQTALADLIWSTKACMIEITDLARMWGREPVQLGREITQVLRKLKEAGILQSFTRRRGRFHFERVTSIIWNASV